MHTYKPPNSKTQFHHNSDFSGDVIISSDDGNFQIDIPFKDLESFVMVKVGVAMEDQFNKMSKDFMEWCEMNGFERLIRRVNTPTSDCKGSYKQ